MSSGSVYAANRMPCPIKIRPYKDTDQAFVFASWLHSFEQDRDKRVGRDLYYQEQHTLVAELLGHRNTILIAVHPEDDNMLYGFLVGGALPVGRVLDYVFVKPVYRRMGIARALLAQFGTYDAYTHSTHAGRAFVPQEAVFDPYLLHATRRK